MNTTTNVIEEMRMDTPVSSVAAKPMMETLMWSIRRELWENRSIYIAPAAIAGLVAMGFLVSVLLHPEVLGFLAALDAEGQRSMLLVPFGSLALLVMMTSSLVAVFYCLDAMYSERRDRSILFWKSLPVSDLTTVLAKMSVPMVVLPAVTFVVVLAAQILLLLVGTVLMLVHHLNPGLLWMRLPIVQTDLVLVYGLVTFSLWYAPVYGWCLLVSSWAKRATLLWALLPWFAAAILEKIALHTSYVGELLKYRFSGGLAEAFSGASGQPTDVQHVGASMPLSDLTPGAYFANPWLWVGLLFAAGFFLAVVRMRRYREPI